MKILIVEDEAAASRMLKNMLVGILGDEIESIQVRSSLLGSECYVWEHPIDLLFLDLDLGGQDGYELLEGAVAGSFQTVIVSAHAERAAEAFEYGVLDFVAKPFNEERILKAVDRFKKGFASGLLRFVAAADEGAVALVPIEEVCYFEACDKRSLICRKDGRVDSCNKMLQALEKILPADFLRIHRSFIVDVREMRGLSARANGRYNATMSNGDVLPVSRDAYRTLKSRIGQAGS